MGGGEGKVAYIGMTYSSLNSVTVYTNGYRVPDTEGTFRPERLETIGSRHVILD